MQAEDGSWYAWRVPSLQGTGPFAGPGLLCPAVVASIRLGAKVIERGVLQAKCTTSFSSTAHHVHAQCRHDTQMSL